MFLLLISIPPTSDYNQLAIGLALLSIKFTLEVYCNLFLEICTSWILACMLLNVINIQFNNCHVTIDVGYNTVEGCMNFLIILLFVDKNHV